MSHNIARLCKAAHGSTGDYESYLTGDFTGISLKEAALHSLYYAIIAARCVTDRTWSGDGRVPMQFLLAGTSFLFIEMTAQAHSVVGYCFSGGGNGSGFDWGAFIQFTEKAEKIRYTEDAVYEVIA